MSIVDTAKRLTPEAVTREMAYPRRDIWVLLAVCFVVRAAFVGINEAAYTDGVLQAIQFAEPVGIWPPLYSALIYPLKFVIPYLWSGRLISVIASTLALYPLYRMCRRAFGTRAALYAGIFYIVAPVAHRWGIRMMSDATFSLFFWWACERLYVASDEREESSARHTFSLACLFTVLAFLTRYQGVLLMPLIAAMMIMIRARFGRWPIKPALPLLGLALIPFWIYLTEETFIHVQQFDERSVAAAMPMWKVLLLNGEAFLLLMPYFITYPVAVFALIGMFWMRQRRGPFFGWMVVFLAISFLVLQSLFSSFQERYFLPVMGFLWILAGAGMYALQERWLRSNRPIRRRLFPYAMIMTYASSALFLVLVAWAQREAFGDVAAASRHAAKFIAPGGTIYTNEVYRAEPVRIAGTKVEFFSGRETRYLHEAFVPANAFDTMGNPTPPANYLEPGDMIVLMEIQGGAYFERYLNSIYRLEPVGDQRLFTASLLPLLPDIMSQPGTAQNPTAWIFRYHWQVFSTTVYRVEGVR